MTTQWPEIKLYSKRVFHNGTIVLFPNDFVPGKIGYTKEPHLVLSRLPDQTETQTLRR